MPPVAVLDAGAGGVATSVDRLDWPVLPPTLLTIHRTCNLDEQTRQIICAVDGRRAGQLLYGETLTVEIAPGPYTGQLLFGRTPTKEIPPGPHTISINNTVFWKKVPHPRDIPASRHAPTRAQAD